MELIQGHFAACTCAISETLRLLVESTSTWRRRYVSLDNAHVVWSSMRIMPMGASAAALAHDWHKYKLF